MHSKKLSSGTVLTAHTASMMRSRHESGLAEENRILKQQAQAMKNQISQVKKSMLLTYQENMKLKQSLSKTNDNQFIHDCQNEIIRLRELVNELMEAKSLGPSQREEIKDRIIMKLEDELISVKIQLKEAKLKQIY